MALKSEFKFEVVEKGGNLIVSLPSGKFKAVYYKGPRRLQCLPDRDQFNDVNSQANNRVSAFRL